jgi:hypothetical protein
MTTHDSQPTEPKKVVPAEEQPRPQKAKKVKPRKVEKKGPRRR